MKRRISMGLLWALGGYFLTIVLIPVMSGEELSTYKLTTGALLWLITGLAIGRLFYDKQSTAKTRNSKKKKR